MKTAPCFAKSWACSPSKQLVSPTTPGYCTTLRTLLRGSRFATCKMQKADLKAHMIVFSSMPRVMFVLRSGRQAFAANSDSSSERGQQGNCEPCRKTHWHWHSLDRRRRAILFCLGHFSHLPSYAGWRLGRPASTQAMAAFMAISSVAHLRPTPYLNPAHSQTSPLLPTRTMT